MPGEPFHKRELVDVITWIITKDGQHILITTVGPVDNASNDSQDTHIRAGGHYVNDIQEHHGGEEVVGASTNDVTFDIMMYLTPRYAQEFLECVSAQVL